HGLIITDALNMPAVRSTRDIGELALSAVEAGADMILVVGNQTERSAVFQRLCQAYRSGRLSDERIRDSLRRILLLKDEVVSTAKSAHGGRAPAPAIEDA